MFKQNQKTRTMPEFSSTAKFAVATECNHHHHHHHKIHRLDFDNVEHCGRTKELEQLDDLFQTVSCHGQAQAVVVEASSGLGKTAFLDALQKRIGDRAVVCSGKFEERTAASEPFSAIVEATTELLRNLASSSERNVWRKRIREAMGTEMLFLESIFPTMQVLFPVLGGLCSEESSMLSLEFDAFGNMADKDWRFERFLLAIRGLFRCISTHVPTVLMLDDLHWIDLDSFSVLKTLLKDSHPDRKFLFVGASRLTESLHCLQELRSKSDDLRVEFLPLPCLSVKDIAAVLANLLERKIPDVVILADIIHEKTRGNSFVVLQLLRMLEQNGLIYYCSEKSQWTWENERVVYEGAISDNITEVVAGYLRTLTAHQKRALAIAAIFRVSHFDVWTIVHAMAFLDGMNLPPESAIHDDGNDNDDDDASIDRGIIEMNVRELNKYLQLAAQDGLVKETSPGHYKFAHDRIREAAYSLLPHGYDKKALHLKIGRKLRSWMDTSAELGTNMSEESLLLNAAKQLNLAGPTLIVDQWERLDLAELNFQAAELAVRKSSFFPAIEYVQQGIRQLSDNPWENNYTMMHKLSVALVRIEYCCGLSADCISTADDILTHAKNFRDKCPVYHTKVLCLLQQEKVKAAEDLVLSVLEELGLRFPRRFLNYFMIRDILKTNKKSKKLSVDDIKKMKEVSEENLNMCADFLERLVELAFLGGDVQYFFMAIARGFSLILQHGRFPLAATTFIGWAFSRVVMGDLKEAYRYGNLGLELADGRHEPYDSRMKVIFYSFISHWRLGLRDGIVPFREAVNALWNHGALDALYQDTHVYYRLMFVCGEPLERVQQESKKYIECLADYNQEIQWNFMVPLVQAVANLQGQSKDPLILTGKYMNEDERQLVWKKPANRPAIFQHQFFVMVLAYHFGAYERAESAMKTMQPLFEDGPDALVQARVLYAGLVYWARFKMTRKRTYRRKAEAAQRQLEKWVHGGAVSCIPMHLLLLAESTSVVSKNSNKDKVILAYDKAIEAMRQSGIRHNEAVANELAAAYLIICQSDTKTAAGYIDSVIRLYEEWGAIALVESVRQRYQAVLK